MNRPGYVDVDQLQAETTLEAAAAKCGITLDVKGSGKEVRIDCPFHCAGDHVGRKEVAINVENPQKVFMCHAYECKFRGNLLTLLHGWLAGTKPTGGRLQGDEFRRVRNILAGEAQRRTDAQQETTRVESPTPQAAKRNVPLIDSEDARVRELHNIDEKFVVDVARMGPTAATYVRSHRCFSSESMKKWRCGYLPGDGGGDKRGWSLRGNIVYPVLSETGQVLAWVMRDVGYELKKDEFGRLAPTERMKRDLPAKHRFPKGFERRLELFGQHATRLREPGYRECIAKHGIIVVEGFNDVIGLDNIGVPAVAIMSNRITEEQVEKITRWATQLANRRVTLMFDCDEPGSEGAKDTLWLLAQRQLDVRLAWSPQMHGGAFIGRQPESITLDEWKTLEHVASGVRQS